MSLVNVPVDDFSRPILGFTPRPTSPQLEQVIPFTRDGDAHKGPFVPVTSLPASQRTHLPSSLQEVAFHLPLKGKDGKTTYAKIDADLADHADIKDHQWFLCKRDDGCHYAYRNSTRTRQSGRRAPEKLYLHREVMRLRMAEEGKRFTKTKNRRKMVVHHKNGKGLDCRSRNLDYTTTSENNRQYNRLALAERCKVVLFKENDTYHVLTLNSSEPHVTTLIAAYSCPDITDRQLAEDVHDYAALVAFGRGKAQLFNEQNRSKMLDDAQPEELELSAPDLPPAKLVEGAFKLSQVAPGLWHNIEEMREAAARKLAQDAEIDPEHEQGYHALADQVAELWERQAMVAADATPAPSADTVPAARQNARQPSLASADIPF